MTRLDRVLWPEVGMTKRDHLRYLATVSPVLLPHLRGRAVTTARFPEGVDGPGWYQAECHNSPEWMRTVTVKGRRDRSFRYCRFDDLASILWAANQGTIEFHPFNWSIGDPSRPLALVLDLDPGEPAALADCARIAIRLRDELHRRRMDVVVKTTGSLGLHLFATPPPPTFGAAKAVARELGEWLAESDPTAVVTSSARSTRRGRVYLDWLQNDPARSTIAPYSVRGTAIPRVSTPVTWDEVEKAAMGQAAALRFGPRDVLDRVAMRGDLFLSGTASVAWPAPGRASERALEPVSARRPSTSPAVQSPRR
jgi:bifunctional non-homologous end joining protein LigD